MARVVFVHAQRQGDAVWEPPRGGVQMGPWWMASLLKERGHEVYYWDESVRGGSWNNRKLFRRIVSPWGSMQQEPLDMTWDELQRQKMTDFNGMDPHAFTQKWSAFRSGIMSGVVSRVVAYIGVPEEQTLQDLADLKPDAVGIPLAPTANYLSATSLGRKIKERMPHVRVFMGGQHITADPEGFVRANPWVDYVADGDAITTIEGMVLGGHVNKIVPGGFQKMDQYPVLDFDLVRDAGYDWTRPTHNYPSGLRAVDWMASRGCYRDCDFCFAGRKEQKVTQSVWDRIEAQLDHFKAVGIQEIVLQDDAILYKADRFFLRLLERMKARGLSFSNNGGMEFESFSPEVADAIVAYNQHGEGRCLSLYIPFNPRKWNEAQTAAGSMLEKYTQNIDGLGRMRQAGVHVFTSLMVGTPHQTPEVLREDQGILRRLVVDGILDEELPLSATLLPGTAWHAGYWQNIIRQDDWVGFNLFSTHHRTDHMSPRQIEEGMVRAVWEMRDVQRARPWQTAFPATI